MLCFGQIVPVMAASPLDGAREMGSNGTVQGSYADDYGVDFYRYTVSPGSSIELNVTFTTYMGGSTLYLYDTSGEELDRDYIYSSSSTNQGVETYTYYLNPGTYYFGVDLYSKGSYKMTYNTRLINNQDLTEDGMLLNAHKLDLNTNLTGVLSDVTGDKTDIYKIDVTTPGILKINLKSYLSSMEFALLNQDGEKMDYWYLYRDSSSGMSVEKWDFPLEQGTYYLEMNANSSGKYVLQQSFTEAVSTEQEPNDSMEQAQILSLGKTAYGMIGFHEETDFYKMKVPTKRNITFTLDSKLRYAQLYIYNADGEEVKYKSEYSNSNTGKNIIKQIYNLSAGTYYVQVRSSDYSGIYTLTAVTTTKPLKPVVTLKRDNRKYYNLIVKNKKVTGADGYQIYLSTNSKFKRANVFSTSNLKNSFSVTKKKIWYVKVRAYKLNSDGQPIYGGFSAVKKIKM